jgi:hypothetical protein
MFRLTVEKSILAANGPKVLLQVRMDGGKNPYKSRR